MPHNVGCIIIMYIYFDPGKNGKKRYSALQRRTPIRFGMFGKKMWIFLLNFAGDMSMWVRIIEKYFFKFLTTWTLKTRKESKENSKSFEFEDGCLDEKFTFRRKIFLITRKNIFIIKFPKKFLTLSNFAKGVFTFWKKNI